MGCGCDSGNDSGNAYGSVCNADTPYPSISHESVPSLIDNLINALYGQITKDVSGGKVVWNLPCDPNKTAVIPGFPRNEGEGLLCYIIRYFTVVTQANGTVTSITAGAGLSGGTIVGSGTIAAIFGTTANTIAQGNDARLNNVLSWSGGLTGLTPSTPSKGDVVLGGVLNVVNGGTGANNAADALINLNAISNAARGAANGVATLGSDGKIPSYQIPGSVDQIIEVATYSALPNPGADHKIYITLDTNNTYRWGGTTYVLLDSGPNPSTIAPLSDLGTGQIGASLDYARADHRHPAVDISTLTGVLPISKGGTGAQTAQAAINNLVNLTTQSIGWVLTNDGSNATFAPLSASSITGTLSADKGGTGFTTYNTLDVLVGVSGQLSKRTLTAGANIAIALSSSQLTISSTGAASTASVASFNTGTTGLTPYPNTANTGNITLGGTLALEHGGTNANSADGAWTTIGLPKQATANPQPLGLVSTGVSSKWAHEDHVHQIPNLSDLPGVLSVAQGGTGTTSQSASWTAIGIPNASNIPGASLAPSGSVGTSQFWARADHVHPIPSTALSGDVSGSGQGTVSVTVGKIQGKTVSSASPASNNALIWNSSTSQWEPQPVAATVIAGGATMTNVIEKTSISASTPGTTLTIALSSSQNGITYFLGSATSDFTLNITGASTYLPNNGDSITITVLNTNGVSGYKMAQMNIDGQVKTVKWQNNISTGNPNSTDAWTFTIIKNSIPAQAYTVLGSVTPFV